VCYAPQEAKEREAIAEAVKGFARAIQDWDSLDEAVEQQISDQRNLVEWWDSNVRKPGPIEINAEPRLFTREQAESITGISQQTVSKWRKHIAGDLDAYRDLLRGPSYRKAMGERGSTDQKGASGTGENEYFTPPPDIERARLVFGGEIDVDPASHPNAQQIIQAKTYYTKETNGLQHEWSGNVWLNPPYSQPLIRDFISKLCIERAAGRITTAIVLTHNYTDTAWFHELALVADAHCFTRGRVRFYKGVYDDDQRADPTQGQVFSYMGNDVAGFAEAFGEVGFIEVPWRLRLV
jgi:phage N-6-adenine-methyltransferase